MTTPIKLEATTPRFNPMPPLSIGSKVLDGTFVTRNPPDVERTAAVVALCPIPYERRGTDDLGWHIADFLAFKALIAPCANPRTQVWLANADVEAAAKNDPHAYSRGPGHGGNGRRNVVGAAGDGIPIIVEPSAPKLLIKFITEITSKAQKAKENDDTMLIIVCGLATLEQDVFFGGGGKGGYDVSITSEQIREAIGSDVRVTFVTPSMTSAGWQVNPSFNHRTVVTQAKPIDFLARQSGGIFGSNIRQHFLSWESPVIDQATAGPTTGPAVDSTIESVRNVRGAYPGPANMNDHQKAARAAFEVKIHEALTSRMARHRGDHSFSFEAMDDDWETLVGPRKGLKLEKLAGLWERLEELPSTAGYGLYFLGNAFGGNKKSQINHIKHMIRESLNSWPGYYATSFGRGVQKELGDFLRSDMPEDLDCHAMFNALEHRMSLMVLGDLVVKNVGLVSAFNMRCRDWDEPKFAELVSESRMQVFSEVFGVINRNIPIMGMPPGRNLNDQRKLHVKLTRAIRFMAGALIMRYREMGTGLDSATGQIVQREFLNLLPLVCVAEC
ncbi:hypothetical protein BJ170DRAFT_470441 [Xylariales sp. AK1849]|nr:hypothetical protein BJ170DRAFT_470441 [Xylariales sp. AK1849]